MDDIFTAPYFLFTVRDFKKKGTAHVHGDQQNGQNQNAVGALALIMAIDGGQTGPKGGEGWPRRARATDSPAQVIVSCQ
jgi:hypothetical protein